MKPEVAANICVLKMKGSMHFSAILSALSKRGLAEEATAFFDRILGICKELHALHGVKLEITSSFNGLIGAHAKSQSPGSAEKAEEVLRKMQNLGPDGHFVEAKPNVRSYTSVMLAWSLVSDPAEKELAVERCEALLQEMLELAERGDSSVLPNQFTFGTFLQVLARSNRPGKKERAKHVLEVMRRAGVKPGEFVKSTMATMLG